MAERAKTSFELAMEKLAAADREAGVVETTLSDAQKQEISEVRKVHKARLAEREILFHDALKGTADPAAREKLEGEFQIDRQRLESDRDRQIEKIRRSG